MFCTLTTQSADSDDLDELPTARTVIALIAAHQCTLTYIVLDSFISVYHQLYSQLRPILMPSMESTPLSLARLRLCKGVAALLNLVEVQFDFLHSDFPCTCNAVAITMQEM